MSDAGADMTRFEALAEAAYAAMYDARPRAVKALYENTCSHFAAAIDMAKRAGRDDDAARLTARRAHVMTVYDRQFRGVGF
ncbi:MAG TPA: hypothetical protein VID77_03010 [Stellaceae bacterium]|jgi:hypothetical protein